MSLTADEKTRVARAIRLHSVAAHYTYISDSIARIDGEVVSAWQVRAVEVWGDIGDLCDEVKKEIDAARRSRT